MVNRLFPDMIAPEPVAEVDGGDDVAKLVADARRAQPEWAGVSLRSRLALLRRVRHRIAEQSRKLAASINVPNRTVAESLMAEVMPLADAIRFLERYAVSILRTSRPWTGRPLWLFGSRLETHRAPFGVILIVSPRNYPLFLAGTQIMQALAAGNSVVVKCAPGHGACIRLLRDMAVAEGLDPKVFGVCDGDAVDVYAAIGAGVDKVILTGSANAGRAVLARLATSLTPAAMELSGCDAAFILPGADLDLAAKALAHGLTFNGSATCIAPRRCFIPAGLAEDFESRLNHALSRFSPVSISRQTNAQLSKLIDDAVKKGARIRGNHPDGLLPGQTHGHDNGGESVSLSPIILCGATPSMGIMEADIFAPVLALVGVTDVAEALSLNSRCPYALGASIFGPESEAAVVANQINAGSVVVNDLIAPTADPRFTFGGCKESGFGVTRGPEGLLEMTRPKSIIVRRGSFRPYYDPTQPGDENLFSQYLLAMHSTSWIQKLKSGIGCVKAILARGKRASPSSVQHIDGP